MHQKDVVRTYVHLKAQLRILFYSELRINQLHLNSMTVQYQKQFCKIGFTSNTEGALIWQITICHRNSNINFAL